MYVDFCLNKRDVEYGQCSKHLSEGPCGKRTGMMNCATCDKLCTGSKYKEKWQKLVEKQEEMVSNLVCYYNGMNIADYQDFIEYRRENELLLKYKDVLLSIERGEKC